MQADAQTYTRMQRRFYDERAVSDQTARQLVHVDYDLAREQAIPTLSYILCEYAARSAQRPQGTDFHSISTQLSRLPQELALLDFGCGVGRLMEPLARQGFHVDGTDISERMLSFARKSPDLADSRFFLSRGDDCGEAPRGHYDLAYSLLCLQHVATRSIRNRIIASIADTLKEGGMVSIQLNYYPGHTADTVPAPHVPWTADSYDAQGTNSEADVWITPDQLHLVLDDFRQHFRDVRLQFVEFPPDVNIFNHAYGTWHDNVLVSGTKGFALSSRIY